MTERITITISGPSQSGKSTLAQFIADRLRLTRAKVVVEDPEGPTEVEFPMRDQAERLTYVVERLLAAGTEIRIVQKTERRRA